MIASTYEAHNGHWFVLKDSCRGEVVSKQFTASLDIGGVRVAVGAHSVVFPLAWLDGNPGRIQKALNSIGAEVRLWPHSPRHVVAIVRAQVGQ